MSHQPHHDGPQQYQQQPQHPPQPQGGYGIPPAMNPVPFDEQPKRNTPMRVICIILAVIFILGFLGLAGKGL
jgi:hypothetical protein